MASILSFPRAGFLCGAVLCSSLASLGQQPRLNVPSTSLHDITLHGQVKSRDGQVISSGVMVTLRTQEGVTMASRPAGPTGNFEFDGLPPAIYILTVTADNYQTYQQNFDLTDGFTFLRAVQIFLLPLDSPKVNLNSLPSMTDQAAPKRARKEFEKGARAWRENNSTAARAHLEKAVAAYPCYARAQSTLAELDIAEHQPDSAVTRYKQAIHCDSTYIDAFYQLARLYMAEKKPQDSETILSQGLRLSPNSWIFHYEMAAAHFALG